MDKLTCANCFKDFDKNLVFSEEDNSFFCSEECFSSWSDKKLWKVRENQTRKFKI